MKMRKALSTVSLAFLLVSHLTLAATTTRVSVNSFGEEGVGNSLDNFDFDKMFVAISTDGRFVAFASEAHNLVADDTNNVSDIFVHDHETGETTRVSVNSRGKEGNQPSIGGIAISANGRFVAFTSDAANLVRGDTNKRVDIFVHDRKNAKTTRVSVNSGGKQGNGESWEPDISANGRFVAFASDSNNLVADDTNENDDIFVHDRKTRKTTRVSVNNRGKEGNDGSGRGPAISADGRFVAFVSESTNLVADDSNDSEDIFVHDRKTGKTTRVSVNSRGKEGNDHSGEFSVDISADGRFVAFPSSATNLVAEDTNTDSDIFVHDRQTGATIRVSVNSRGKERVGPHYNPVISGNGRFVAFESDAIDLVDDDDFVPRGRDLTHYSDVFMHDRRTGETIRLSVNNRGEIGKGGSGRPAISGDGHIVAFESQASNLVPNDSNREQDTFLYDRDRDIVNEYITFEPPANSFRMVRKGRDCKKGFVGRFIFDALLSNVGDAELADLHMPVARLTGGNKLVTESALIGPNGEIPVPERDDYADGILGPGESVVLPLAVCLRDHQPFEFYVDVADDRNIKVYESATLQVEFRFIVGLDGDDTLKGTSGDDTLIGFDGNDTLRGKGGDDLILGGRGNDELRGDKGTDVIVGGAGNDRLRGNAGDDELRGDAGDDQLGGGNGDDLLFGGSGNDALNGGRDIDTCNGDSGTNTLRRCEL